MNQRTPSFLARVTAAIARWAREQRRLAEDERYWQGAQHDRRLVVDISSARARSELASPVAPPRRSRPSPSGLTPLIARREVADH